MYKSSLKKTTLINCILKYFIRQNLAITSQGDQSILLSACREFFFNKGNKKKKEKEKKKVHRSAYLEFCNLFLFTASKLRDPTLLFFDELPK